MNGNIQRLDRILRAEGDDPNRYKIVKRADTVMLFYLFSDAELRRVFGRLGYDYEPDTAVRNVEYYDQRTSHGSTLSIVTHAVVLAAIDAESSWDRFLAALRAVCGAPLTVRSGQLMDFYVPGRVTLRRATTLLGPVSSRSQADCAVRIAPVRAAFVRRVDLVTNPFEWPLAHPRCSHVPLSRGLGASTKPGAIQSPAPRR